MRCRWLQGLIASAGSVVVLGGCATASSYTAPTFTNIPYVPLIYRLDLASVERPAKAKERYGPPKIATVTDSGITKYSFLDSLVGIVWLPTPTSFSFWLENKTDHSIHIIWDDAAFVGVD